MKLAYRGCGSGSSLFCEFYREDAKFLILVRNLPTTYIKLATLVMKLLFAFVKFPTGVLELPITDMKLPSAVAKLPTVVLEFSYHVCEVVFRNYETAYLLL